MIFTDFRDLHNRPDSLLGIRWALLGSLLDFKWLKKKKTVRMKFMMKIPQLLELIISTYQWLIIYRNYGHKDQIKVFFYIISKSIYVIMKILWGNEL